jgi:superoxide dismutase, Fe-Mn family
MKIMETAEANKTSGWIWLCVNEKEKLLRIVWTNNEDNPLMYGILAAQYKPILAIDMWEHAWLPEYKLDKMHYVQDTLDNRINWSKVTKIYEVLAGSKFQTLPNPLELL